MFNLSAQFIRHAKGAASAVGLSTLFAVQAYWDHARGLVPEVVPLMTGVSVLMAGVALYAGFRMLTTPSRIQPS